VSDYQRVVVKAIDLETNTVTIDVEEYSDSRALSSLFDKRPYRGFGADGETEASEEDWIKIGAMLLLEDKVRSGKIDAPDDGSPEPAQYVSKVVKLIATKLGEGSSDNAIYQASLAVTLVDGGHAKLFEAEETWGAVADLGGDFDNMFG
jgi:hypothetical protein